MTPWLSHLFDVILQSPCPLCNRSAAEVLCRACQQQVHRCQLSSTQHWQIQSLPVFAWGSYSGGLKRSLTTLKYHHQPRLARPLGQWLAESWLANPPVSARLTVVPIPMHASKQQQRGFNQSELLAEAFCQRTGFPLARQGLVRHRATAAQFGLGAAARAENLTGAFQLGSGFLRQPPQTAVLLLDDIFTTGATATAAAQTLRQHGISVVGIAVVARAEWESQPPQLRLKRLKGNAR
ncbi:MAG: ComF family protein [Synechococcales cyanobacterium C42_A2020_086]|jgi:ComF family protein|nr:ComF family protein [Synechococcales cyanobacterium C42_A2020_086]